MHSTPSGYKLDVQKPPGGFYYIIIKQGEKTIKQRFIKQ